MYSSLKNYKPIFQHSRIKDPNINGIYDPLNCIIEVKKEYSSLLKSDIADLSYEKMLAAGTFLHESIHWWQVAGSTIGFILGSAYTAQTIVSINEFKAITNIKNCKKPLFKTLKDNSDILSEKEQDKLNIIFNNWHDLEMAINLLNNPLDAKEYILPGVFENLGYTFRIMYSSVYGLIKSTFNGQDSINFNHPEWVKYYESKEEKKILNYYYGSDLAMPPIGAAQLYEGQARLSELQYYSEYISDDFGYWNSQGYLSDIYIYAWDMFLRLTDLKQPKSVCSPEVFLFLLVVDIALNPEYPYPSFLPGKDNFDLITELHPGFRFTRLCRVVKQNQKILDKLQVINNKSYNTITEFLYKKTGFKAPNAIAEVIYKIYENSDLFLEMENNYINNKFSEINLPIRILYSRHLKLMKAKKLYPEFFAWPGYYLTQRVKKSLKVEDMQVLIDDHRAPFIYNHDTNAVGYMYPLSTTYDESFAITTHYFNYQMFNDLLRQWIVKDGPFQYNFAWIDNKYSVDDYKKMLSKIFEYQLNININDIEIHN